MNAIKLNKTSLLSDILLNSSVLLLVISIVDKLINHEKYLNIWIPLKISDTSTVIYIIAGIEIVLVFLVLFYLKSAKKKHFAFLVTFTLYFIYHTILWVSHIELCSCLLALGLDQREVWLLVTILLIGHILTFLKTREKKNEKLN